MLRRSFTAVLERDREFTADFATEPYEAAWAGEARWFLRILEMSGEQAALDVTPQISPDGLFWCAEGHKPPVISAPGMYSFATREFGHWLRIRCKLAGKNPKVRAMIYLALKE